MTEVIAKPPPASWGADLTGPAFADYALQVGRFNDSDHPEFRPATLHVRVGDRVEWSYNSIRDVYKIVQAKSADEPCTRLPKGLYADVSPLSDEWLNENPEMANSMGMGYAWYIPYNATESTVWYYAEGHCEQGMRGSFVVSGIASSSWSPEFTDADTPYSTVEPTAYGSSGPYAVPADDSSNTAVLTKPQAAGLAVGLTAAVLLLGVLVRVIYRRRRAQKTEKMKGPVTDMINGVQVTTYDGAPIQKFKTRDSVASSV